MNSLRTARDRMGVNDCRIRKKAVRMVTRFAEQVNN